MCFLSPRATRLSLDITADYSWIYSITDIEDNRESLIIVIYTFFFCIPIVLKGFLALIEKFFLLGF